LSDGLKVVGAAVGVLLLVLALSVAGLFWDRHAQPYAEETRRITYEQSQTHVDAVSIDLTDLCRQYRTATDQDAKDGFAETIRLHAEHANINSLPAKTQECVNALL
jgi:hypothetical protein